MSEDDAWGTRGSGRREGGGSKDDGVALQRLGDPIVDRDSSPWEHGPEVNNPTAAIWNPLVPMKSILPMENDGGIGTRDEPAYEADFFLEYMPDVNKALAHTKATLPFNGERDDGSSIPIGRFTLREKLQNERDIVAYLGMKARRMTDAGDDEESNAGLRCRRIPVPTKEELEDFEKQHGTEFLREFGLGVSLYLKSIHAFLFLALFMFLASLPQLGFYSAGNCVTQRGITVLTDVVPHTMSLGHVPYNSQPHWPNTGINRQDLFFLLSLIDSMSWLIWMVVVGIMQRRQQSETVIADIILTTASDYTILVRKIPMDSTSHSVKQYFERDWPAEIYADWAYSEARITEGAFDRDDVRNFPVFTSGLNGQRMQTCDRLFKYTERREKVKKETSNGTVNATFYKLVNDAGDSIGWIHDFNEENPHIPTIKDHAKTQVADVVVHMACSKMIKALERRGKAFQQYDKIDGLLQYTKKKIADITAKHPVLSGADKSRPRKPSISEEFFRKAIKVVKRCCAPDAQHTVLQKAALELETALNQYQQYEFMVEEMGEDIEILDARVRDFERRILAEGDKFDDERETLDVLPRMRSMSLEAGAGQVEKLPGHSAARQLLNDKKGHGSAAHDDCSNTPAPLRMKANCAFVTFNDPSDAECVLRDVEKKKQKGILPFQYTAERSPEPDDIIFENLEVGSAERRRRFRWNYLIITILLIMTGVTTSLVRIFYYLQEANRLNNEDDAKGDWTYCAQQGVRAWHRDRCYGSYLKERMRVAGIILLCNLFVSGMNLVLKFIIRLRVRTEKHATVSKQAVSEMRLVFLAQYINTSVLVGFFGGSAFLDGEMMNPSWYSDNGTSLFVVTVVNAVADEIEVSLRRLKKNFDKRFHRARTQQELNEAYRYMKFNLAYQYASLLSMIFSCATFSSGIPLTNLSLLLFLFIRYKRMRLHLFRYYRKPRRYGCELAEEFMKILPFAAPIHLIVGISMYQNSKYTTGDPSQHADDNIHSVLFSKQTMPMFIGLMIMALNLIWLRLPDLFPTWMRKFGFVQRMMEWNEVHHARIPSWIFFLKQKVNYFKHEVLEELPPWNEAVNGWTEDFFQNKQTFLYEYRMETIPEYIDRFSCDARSRRHSDNRATLFGQRASAELYYRYSE